MSTSVDDLINRWISRMPDGLTAYRNDPTYHTQITWMRRMLAVLDVAMEDEGIPEQTRLRVVRSVVYGSPDESEALARVDAMKAQAEELSKRPLMIDVTDIWRKRP